MGAARSANQFKKEVNVENKKILNHPTELLVGKRLTDPLNHVSLLKQKVQEHTVIREPCPVISRAPEQVFQRKIFCRGSSQKRM